MLTELHESEFELLKKTIREELGEDLIDFDGIYSLCPSSFNILDFCEYICLPLQEKESCSNFHEFINRKVDNVFSVDCSVGIKHYLVPFRYNGKHLTNICIASRRTEKTPKFDDFFKHKKEYSAFINQINEKYFQRIPLNSQEEENIIKHTKQIKVISSINKSIGKGVGASIFFKNVLHDLLRKESDLDGILDALLNYSKSIWPESLICIYLDKNKTIRYNPTSFYIDKVIYDKLLTKFNNSEKTILLTKDAPGLGIKENIKSLLVTLMKDEDNIIGCMLVGSYDEENLNKEVHGVTLENLAEYATTAIKFAKYYECQQDETDKREVLYKIINEMVKSENYDVFLFWLLTASTLKYGAGFNRAIFLGYNKDDNILNGFMGKGPKNIDGISGTDGSLDKDLNNKNKCVEFCRKEVQNGKTESLNSDLNIKIKEIHINLDMNSENIFSSCIKDKRYKRIHGSELISHLEKEMKEVFESLGMHKVELAVVPVVYWAKDEGEVKGILLVDNIRLQPKNNISTIQSDELDLLEKFTRIAAIIMKKFEPDTVGKLKLILQQSAYWISSILLACGIFILVQKVIEISEYIPIKGEHKSEIISLFPYIFIPLLSLVTYCILKGIIPIKSFIKIIKNVIKKKFDLLLC